MIGTQSLGTLVVYLAANATQYDRVMKEVETSNKVTMDVLIKNAKYAAAAVAGTMAAIGTASVREFMKFESSFAGVRKTLNATEAQFKQIEKDFRGMSLEIPVDVNEINKVGELAGQLGIKVPQLKEFTRVMIDLGVSTNLGAEEAATSLAQFANVTGMSQKNFGKLGSSIVALGNTMATTEKDIVSMGMRLAGAGTQVGMNEHEIMGLAAALSSLGIAAEAGGTATSQAMIIMAKSVAMNSQELELFASIAGKTTADFKKQFQEDASGAIIDFLLGLGRVKKEGGNVYQMLESLGIEGARMTDVITRSAGAQGKMAEALRVSKLGWEGERALQEEAAKRYATLESQLKILMNMIKDMAISIGMELAPAVKAIVGLFGDASRETENFSKNSANLGTTLAKALMTIAGMAADVVAGWKLIRGFGEIAFGVLIMGAVKLGAMLAGLFENVGNSATQAFNLIIRGWNAVATKMGKDPMKEITFTRWEWVKGLESLAEDTEKAVEQSVAEVNKLIDAGKPSAQIWAAYEKVITDAKAAAVKADAEVAKANKEVAKSIEEIKTAVAGTNPLLLQFQQLMRPGISENAKSLAQFGTLASNPKAGFSDATSRILSQDNEFLSPISGMKGAVGITEVDQISAVENETKLLEDAFFTRHDMLESFYDMAKQSAIDNNEALAVIEEDYQKKELEMIKNYQAQRDALEKTKSMMLLGSAQAMFGSLSDIMKDAFGEQKGIYKAMFIASKAFAIAEAVISIQLGIAQAAKAEPWFMKIPAMASVTAATAGLVSSISSVMLSFEGGGHTGDSPRRGGMDGKGGFLAMLHPKERVIDETLEGDGYGGGRQGDFYYSPTFTGGVTEEDLIRQTEVMKNQTKKEFRDEMLRGGSARDILND